MERKIIYQIKTEEAGLRVDQFLHRRSYSRKNLAQLKNCSNSTRINGKSCRLMDRLSVDDILEVSITEKNCSENIPATALPLTIVYEDEDILVVDKPAGLPIHPSKDNYYYSLANAVMYYYRNCSGFVFRCTNRLDRDTSGLTVIAKHAVSAGILGTMVKESGNQSGSISRLFMEREYTAIACGEIIPASGTIDAPLSLRLPRQTALLQTDADTDDGVLPERSIERCVDFEHGERAVTHYRVLEAKNNYSLVSILLETGRTHQIRVHMAYLGCPLAGDYLYNPECRRAATKGCIELPAAQISGFEGKQRAINIPCVHVPPDINGISRQALHASRLKFTHPISGKIMEFRSPLPMDMQRLKAQAFHS
ncbi:MAG: RluA family pseudouridine synthase [Clostridiales bacterium]|nr:RluA family pseudouridine synthase [Clostridiales bacterium]